MPRGIYERPKQAGPATRGKRVDVIQAPPQEVTEGTDHVYICTARPLRVGKYTLYEGVEVPGAHEWLRLESWVNTRRVRRVKDGESYTSWEAFIKEAPSKE